MEFNPANKIIQYCLQGKLLEEQDKTHEAIILYKQALTEASDKYEEFLATYFSAGVQQSINDKIIWLKKSLTLAREVDEIATISAMPTIYLRIAACYAQLNDSENEINYLKLAEDFNTSDFDKGPFYHGTKADLLPGDELTPGRNSNYISDLIMNHIYFTALPNGAGLAAALASGNGRERVYIVMPTGPFENDPNVTDKKFPGNPTRSYRTSFPLKITGEITDWQRQSKEEIELWRKKLADNKGEIIN